MLTIIKQSLSKSLPAITLAVAAIASINTAQALDIKQEQIDSCVQAADNYKMADPATAQTFCSCTINVRGRMTLDQMWQIESYARSDKDPATLPFAQKMQDDLKQCASGLTLNAPQQPS